ncbi:hypothetical protein F2Q68_00017375 [Brassica cretica]|uniref:Uncharacterized protein n=1 Tax=Brassica cretica TaxID=69181 RepID=A0A8S9HGY3_BRACR|nr:hypothetical protein F2Q68_00017375 [Brassica cretica]
MIFAESSHQRISFAGDLHLRLNNNNNHQGWLEETLTLLDSEFEFHTSRSFDSSPADEIFADGMILPFQATSSMPKRRYNLDKHSSLRHGGAPRPQADPSSCPPSACCSSYQFRPQKQSGKNSGSSRGGSFRITPVIGGPSPFGLGKIRRPRTPSRTSLIVFILFLCNA